MRGHPFPRKLERLAILLAVAVPACLPGASFGQSAERLIVKRDPGLSAQERADLRADAGARLVDVMRLPHTEVVTVPAATADDALAELQADPHVVYAEPDRVRSLSAAPNDQLWPSLWGLSNTGQAPFAGTPGDDIHALDAWSYSQGAGQTVAVVDSGIDLAHDDLAGQIAPGGRNFVQGMSPSDLSDPLGHGTHVSGTIAARGNNAIGVVGVAPGAKVLPLRAVDNRGDAFDSWIAQAFDYAGELGVRVVNASLGGEGSGPSLTLASAIAAHPDTLYVAAAGNGGTDGVGDNNDVRSALPCNVPQPNVVCVGASDYNDQRAPFSNYGAKTVDLFAPGVEVGSTWPGGGYRFQDGTSMATPHVAGEAALLLAAAPSLTSQELKDLITGTVDGRPTLSGLSVSGGRANAGAALRRLIGRAPDAEAVVFAPAVTGAAPAAGAVVPALPRLRSLTVRISPRRCRRARTCRRRVAIAISGDRAATAEVTLELRRCRRRRCRWVLLASPSVAMSRGRATLRLRARRLARGSYRATAVLSSEFGAGPPRRKAFRIR
jgi:thermitase